MHEIPKICTEYLPEKDSLVNFENPNNCRRKHYVCGKVSPAPSAHADLCHDSSVVETIKETKALETPCAKGVAGNTHKDYGLLNEAHR